MRRSDILASNWNYIWAFFILFLNSLQVSGLLSFSSLTLLLVSATISFVLIFVALLIDALIILHSDAHRAGLRTSNGSNTRNAGICWYNVHNGHVLCNDYKEFM